MWFLLFLGLMIMKIMCTHTHDHDIKTQERKKEKKTIEAYGRFLFSLHYQYIHFQQSTLK